MGRAIMGTDGRQIYLHHAVVVGTGLPGASFL